MIRRPPRSTRTDTLVPYTTLFRSPGLLISVVVTPYPLRLVRPPANAMRRTVSITAFEQAVHHVGDDQRPRLDRPPSPAIADSLGLPARQFVAGLPERHHPAQHLGGEQRCLPVDVGVDRPGLGGRAAVGRSRLVAHGRLAGSRG